MQQDNGPPLPDLMPGQIDAVRGGPAMNDELNHGTNVHNVRAHARRREAGPTPNGRGRSACRSLLSGTSREFGCQANSNFATSKSRRPRCIRTLSFTVSCQRAQKPEIEHATRKTRRGSRCLPPQCPNSSPAPTRSPVENRQDVRGTRIRRGTQGRRRDSLLVGSGRLRLHCLLERKNGLA